MRPRIAGILSMLTRRAFAALALAAAALPGEARAAPGLLGPARRVSFEDLVDEARHERARPYRPAPSPAPEVLDAIDYDAHGKLRHDPVRGLYPGGPDAVGFFHLGKMFRRPVRLFAWEDGIASEVAYRRTLFEVPAGNPAERMPDGAGFAGFRYHTGAADGADWLAFLGASYFRSAGDGGQYGISARGLAVDTAPMPGGREDFPDFTRFYIGPMRDGAATILAYLDGESVTGAFRIVARRAPSLVTEVECRLFPRRTIDRLGIAPLTSMYWYSETNKWISDEYRSEVHDSDGLLLHTGAGERIWRPLANPPGVTVSAFADRGPRGFGLMQRDRDFDHYRDDVAFERRPNLWVEPIGDWGPGSVQLVEIPTVREYDDNMVAMWVPERRPGPADALAYAYRLHWSVTEPSGGDPALARCLATRTSKSVETPAPERRPGNPARERQYVLDFDGPALAGIDPRTAEVVLSLSRGVASDVGAWPDGNGARRPWRVFFKLLAEGPAPVDMRLFLRADGRTLSETWIGQDHPGQHRA